MERDTIALQPFPRRTIASYRTYPEAQRAIDYLSDQKFPVERTAIVAEGLTLVEQVTGRLGFGRAALNGAISAGLAGLFFGWLFGLFNWITPVLSSLTLAFYGLVFGAILGAVLGLIFHAVSGGQRDFTSVSAIQAERYNVMVDHELAEEAAQLLQQMR